MTKAPSPTPKTVAARLQKAIRSNLPEGWGATVEAVPRGGVPSTPFELRVYLRPPSGAQEMKSTIQLRAVSAPGQAGEVAKLLVTQATYTHAKRSEIVSVHKFRRGARRRERAIQKFLEHVAAENIGTTGSTWAVPTGGITGKGKADLVSVPTWARGARVEKAGRFQHAVIATATPGH